MSPDSMPSMTLDDLLAFNEHLLRLDRAGMPISLGSQPTEAGLDAQLSRISSYVALQIGRSQPIADALADAAQVPVRYARALNAWHVSDKHPSALEILVRPAEATASRRTDVSMTLIQPLVVMVIVYIGLLILVWRVAPIMELMFQESRAARGPFLSILLFLRDTQTVWIVAFPIVAIALLWLWNSRSRAWQFSWVPGSQAATRSVELSTLVDGLASRIAAGQDWKSARDPWFADTANPTAQTQTQIHTEGNLKDTYPLVQWALDETGSSVDGPDRSHESQVLLLKNLARVYRGRACALAIRWRRWLPIVIGTLLGGAIVLPYGLMLFGPMIELLLEICQPRKVG